MQLSTFLTSFLLLPFCLGAVIPQDQGTKGLNRLAEEYKAAVNQIGHCDISNAHLPLRGESPELPSPDYKLKLKYVAFGVGTQNYTCAGNDTPTEPASVGALATLYDGACLVNLQSQALNALKTLALRLPMTRIDGLFTKSFEMDKIGHHYFVEKAPFFDLRTQDNSDHAMVGVTEKVPAPDAKNVDWLKLDKTSGSGIQEVFRVNTRYGKAPKSCKGQKPHFEVRYTAQYWMYG